jgi:hypothetical protein
VPECRKSIIAVAYTSRQTRQTQMGTGTYIELLEVFDRCLEETGQHKTSRSMRTLCLDSLKDILDHTLTLSNTQ